MSTSRTPLRFAPLAILGAFLLMLAGPGNASAEYAEDVDCHTVEGVEKGIAACFEKLTDCPEENKVSSDCRNMKQYCTCIRKKGEKKDEDAAEEKAKKQEEKADKKAEKEKEKAIKKAIKEKVEKGADQDESAPEDLMLIK